MEKSTMIRYVVKNKITDTVYLRYYSVAQIEREGLAKLFDVENYNILARDRPIGMKDTDGLYIHEGDVCVINYGRWSKEPNGKVRRATVQYDLGNAKFIYAVLNSKVKVDFSIVHASVIEGNIHQHPELLN